LDWSPNGHIIATGSLDNQIRIWDVRGAKCAYTIPAHKNLVSQVRFWHAGDGFESGGAPDGWTLQDMPTELNGMDVDSKAKNDADMDVKDDDEDDDDFDPGKRKEDEDSAPSLRRQLLSGGHLVSSSYDGTCRIYTEGDWKPIKSLSGLEGKVMCCDVSGARNWSKLSNPDSDFRFMALSDLGAELKKDSNQLEESSEKKIVAAVIKSLDDKNSEVQNEAVKLLGPLVKKVREPQLQDVVDQLCSLLTQKKEELRDISAIGLKTVILEVSPSASSTRTLVRRLIPRLVNLLQDVGDVQLDTIDILGDILARFGHILTSPTDPADKGVQGPQLSKQIQDTLLPLLDHARPAVRKRTTVAIGNFVIHASDELFDQLVARVEAEMKAKEAKKNFEKLRTLVATMSTLSRFSSRRLGKHLPDALPYVLKYSAFDDDELRENCFQALESFILRCPTEITPHLQTITSLALDYVKYDPNYDDGDDEDGMDVDGEDEEHNEMDADGEEAEEDEDDDYSDEDDMSWKVRRASAKLLASIIGTRTELLTGLFADVAPVLIRRFKEREESVRIEIISTFITLIRQVGAATRGQTKGKWKRAGANKADPRSLLEQQVPKLSKSLAKQLSGKSVQTRQMGFVLLRELVVVLDGGLDARVALFIPAIESSLASSKAGDAKAVNNTNLKIDVLQFLRCLFETHQASVFEKHLTRLVPPVIAAANDKFYKITSEALLVVVGLIKIIRPVPHTELEITPPPASAAVKKSITLVYTTTLDRLKTSDVDLEVKERSIMALGTLVSETGDLLSAGDLQGTVIPVLVERLRNELTRLCTLRVLKSIMESPIFSTFAGKEFLPPSIAPEIATYLRKAQRQLRVASLTCLDALIKRFGMTWPIDVNKGVLAELKPLLVEADLNIFPLAIGVIGSVVNADASGKAVTLVQSEMVPAIVSIILEHPHLVVAGAGLDSLLNFWKIVVVKGGSPVFKESVRVLMEPVTQSARGTAILKQAYRPLAQSLATLCVNDQKDSSPVVLDFIKTVQNSATNENVKLLALLSIGEIGRNMDVSGQNPTIHTTLLELFASPSDEIKHAAAFALGNIAIGNMSFFLPIVFKAVREGGKRRYLVLVSLKEIIARSGPNTTAAAAAHLVPFAPELWTLLFSNTEEAQEEGTRTVIAECLGKLALSDPSTYLPELRSRLSSNSAAVRSTVVAAIRYTFSDSVSEQFDSVLEELLVDFLMLVQDPDLNVRRVSLHTLNSAAHNKPHLISASLGKLMPLLYQETLVNQSLIKIVEMGPFKHTVDDGLDARKSAYECMFTLLETSLAGIDVFSFLDHVVNGLTDASQDIKTLCHLMLQRLAVLSPTVLVARLDVTIAPLKEIINTKPKGNAVKQEIEKLNDLVRSGVRTALILARLTGSSGSGVAAVGADAAVINRYDEFIKECRNPSNASVADIFASVHAELEAQHAMGGGGRRQNGLAPMDLS
ncbi:Cullin-associated NEDD8-dissociated protein 1, partial [Irineochytrium annulatum]